MLRRAERGSQASLHLPTLPVVGPALMVRDGCYPDECFELDKKDGVREAMDDASAETRPAIGREGSRIFSNTTDCCLNHKPKFAAQAGSLSVVVGCGGAKLSLSLRVEYDRLHGCSLRSSAKTSSAGRPLAFPV